MRESTKNLHSMRYISLKPVRNFRIFFFNKKKKIFIWFKVPSLPDSHESLATRSHFKTANQSECVSLCFHSPNCVQIVYFGNITKGKGDKFHAPYSCFLLPSYNLLKSIRKSKYSDGLSIKSILSNFFWKKFNILKHFKRHFEPSANYQLGKRE